jgi:hypothetical protein
MARETPQPGDEIDLDAWLEEGDNKPPRRPGVMMRHPLLLLAVLAAASFLLVQSLPRALAMFTDPTECGDISDRPERRRVNPDAVPDLPIEGYCHLTGVSQSRGNLATGEQREDTDDPYEKNAGRKIYVKLVGDRVFAVLPANRAVLDYRLRQDGLVGYPIDAVGRIFDPEALEGYGDTVRTLRLKFSLPSDASIRIFDTTDDPRDRWPYLIVSIVLALTALLALYGLVKLLLARRR